MIGHLNLAGADTWGQSLFFILIGLILFTAHSRSGINAQTLIGFSLVILYMMTPLQMILNISRILQTPLCRCGKSRR